ncbi:MAG: L-ribulose-5-phosphate 4-epimerase AraD [Fimbriimonadaceae bacterium]|nr:L-ribulose-5-phosphate 4-epimerase AraD [Fimbriimonadaceae bacterium]
MQDRRDQWQARVAHINREIGRTGLAPLTWGNASGLDRATGELFIKPSGVPYAELTPNDIVILDLETLHVIQGDKRPSSDLRTHAALYRAFPRAGGIVHTHSHHATAWAQLSRPLPCLGTTHADHFAGDVPCTRALTPAEIEWDYTAATGSVITECFGDLDPADVPAAFVTQHGPFVWGPNPETALDNAVALEACCQMALLMMAAGAPLTPIDPALATFHFRRKHGPNATYGQP